MPIRLTLLFFIILFAKTNSSAPTTIIKTDINGYMSFLLSNSDLLLNFVFKLYHKTCEQFYRNFGLYEKSPDGFLPGLSRSIINQFRFHNLLCPCLASVHLPHPFHLVFGFQLLGHAVLLRQLRHDQLHAVSCRFVNLGAILSYVHPAIWEVLLMSFILSCIKKLVRFLILHLFFRKWRKHIALMCVAIHTICRQLPEDRPRYSLATQTLRFLSA